MPKSRKKKTQRRLAPVFHIFCEGEKTEPNYINGYVEMSFPGNRRLHVIQVVDTKKNTPLQLVQEAINKQNSEECPDGDIFWVVYDRESVVKYPEQLHHDAHQLALNHSVNIALSNVCFEVWILLHFQNSTAPYSSYDELIKNSDLNKKYIKNYNKGDKGIFRLVSNLVDAARKNAAHMNAQTINHADPEWTKPYQFNPFTDVYKLLDAIDDFALNKRGRTTLTD